MPLFLSLSCFLFINIGHSAHLCFLVNSFEEIWGERGTYICAEYISGSMQVKTHYV